MMESLFISEEWLMSNVLSATDLYEDVQGTGGGLYYGGAELIKEREAHVDVSVDDLSNDDSGIGNEFDAWLDQATSLSSLETPLPVLDGGLQPLDPAFQPLDVGFESFQYKPANSVADVLAELEAAIEPNLESPVGSFEAQAEFLMPESKANISLEVPNSPIQSPASPIEDASMKQFISPVPVKYVQPSSIDVSGLSSHAQIVMDDLNVLHLPEPGDDNQAAMLLIQALSDPNVAGELNLAEVESILSSPPSSPEAMVPASPMVQADDSDEEEYQPPSKRRSTGRHHSLKTLQPDERKARKKLQNKNAATKYRLKKRAEEDGFKTDYQKLDNRNKKLKRQVGDLESEIKYMKGLLNEALKDTGLRIK